MIETLKTLLQKQKEIFKSGNFKDLNTINKQIFEIRQQLQKQKQKEKEIEIENKINQKIIEILEA